MAKFGKRIFLYAFLITAFLLVTIVLLGNTLNTERKEYVDEQMNLINDLNEIQTYVILSDVYGQKLGCLAFTKKLREWDESLWDLGLKLERYRAATEEFQKDPYYLEQKRIFNENEVLYMAFLTKAKNECQLNTSIISFFYKKKEDCEKCDDQSFVLTDIKRELRDEVSIFSFDMDLQTTNTLLIAEFYGIKEFPCIVINEEPICGMQDKNVILKKMCASHTMSICRNIK